MLRWTEHIWNEETGLNEYLPGTPHGEHRYYQNLEENFPYHVMGRGRPSWMPRQHDRNTKSAQLFREQETLRRRQFPSCFEEACAFGNLQAAILMWAQGLIDIPTRRVMYEGNDASALMWAAFKGHLPIVRFLVDQGAPLEYVNALGHTALLWAIIAGNADVVRYLLDHGADPSHRDRQGFDAAFTAVQSNNLAVLLMLTEDAAREGHLLQTTDHGLVFYKPSVEQEAQAATCVNPRTKKPYYLLNPQLRDVEGHTLMHWAAYRNSPAMCQYLLDHWGFDADAQDSRGRTPLVWAAREGFAEVIELLLSRGADRHIADGDGWTALNYANLRGHSEAVYALESHPALGRPIGTSSATADALSTFHEKESEKSVKAALLPTVDAVSTTNSAHYVSVRERRAAGTLRMIRTHVTFAVMAIIGPLYLALAFLVTHMLPPVTSYFPFGSFFFKNMLYTALMPRPTQSSSRSDSSPSSPLKELGVSSNIADSARGTWRYRTRDPANLFIWLAFLVLQVYAWNSLGLVPLFSSRHAGTSQDKAGALWGTTAAPPAGGTDRQPIIHYLGLPLVRLLTFQGNPLDQLEADTQTAALMAAEDAYMAQSANLVRWVLMLTLLISVTCAVLCKLFAGRSFIRASEEGTLRTSPIWRIVASRQYRWLHPRFFFQERHTQMPLRVFYCHERDILVRGYDGYSTLLDSPIGRSNHVFFLVSLTSFVLFEVLVMVWGFQQTRALLRCPAHVPWYHDAFYGFRTTETLAAAVRNATSPISGAATSTAVTMTPQAAALPMLAAVAPIASLAWLNTIMEVLLHGLPCRQYRILDEITLDFVNAEATPSATSRNLSRLISYLRHAAFLFRFYIWPTRASVLGVWVLHYSAISSLLMGHVAVRQWLGVWRGATRIELANPLAQGNDGELVSIFPEDSQRAQRVELLSEDEERYYMTVCPSKVHTITSGNAAVGKKGGGRCLYANGNGIINVLAFFLGKNATRWVGAMTVSPHNTPVKTPMLL
ncbi:hypothetical protein JKF63_07735 [Porcisia hertigi]|uniref:Uncharacterized protein n=1 Tax=Porcisia hertigi TaxID=2761500 RepID=A0A836LLU1_9TRYP|nr:hypothetical protein JKF63_07735 [Porcisia hertigi]